MQGNGQVIFFDIGHTLATGAALSARRLLASRLQLSEKETKRVGRTIMTDPATEPGSIVTALNKVLPNQNTLRLRRAVADIWQQQIDSVREMPGATKLIKSLKTIGFTLGIISNIWHPFYQGFSQTCGEILDLMDYVFLSYRMGCKKPSVELYSQAVERVGQSPACCWMVGDTYELDVEPAQKAGMHTIWVLRRPEIEKRLLVQTIRREKRPPDWTVEDLEEVSLFFHRMKELQ